MKRLCIYCNTEIPAKRLEAMPTATSCVPCLTERGDVAPLKRFDEMGFDGEIISTHYVTNGYIDTQLTRVGRFNPPDEEELQTADYNTFIRPVGHIGGYGMQEAFEEDEDEDGSSAE